MGTGSEVWGLGVPKAFQKYYMVFVADDVLNDDMAEMMTIFWKADDRFPEVGFGNGVTLIAPQIPS